MATVIENKKNGKTVSYKFRAYLGRNEIGKQINQYTTWFAPEGLTPVKALKAARGSNGFKIILRNFVNFHKIDCDCLCNIVNTLIDFGRKIRIINPR